MGSELITTSQKMDMLYELIGECPYAYATKHYGKEIGAVLRGVISKKIYKTLRTCKHARDKRSITGFAKEMVTNWILEDFIVNTLRKMGYKVWHNGVDRKREFLPSHLVDSSPDFRVMIDGTMYYVEMIADWLNFWERAEYGHMRDNKLPNLVKLSKDQFVTVLCVDLVNRSYGFVEIEPDTPCVGKPNPIWDGKLAYNLTIPRKVFLKLPQY